VNKELVVALANATLAIQGLVSISNNGDWMVPDYTFSATGLSVLNARRKLHICDVSLIDWQIDMNLISNRKKVFGILPVMPFGSAIDFNPYKDFNDVIIDAAASLGAPPPEFSEMPESWAVVFSLHATKVLGAGEGAIVVCGNRSQAESLRAWSNFGFSSNRVSDIEGTNAKMSEMNAAYGIYALQNSALEKADWLKSQDAVSSQTSNYPWTTFVNSSAQFHPYWIASFKNNQEKKLVVSKLEQARIQTREWWAKPLSLQKAFSESESLTLNGNAKHLSDVHLGLPMYRGLSANDIQKICEVIHSGILK
jgi:dTDP-4-amino-4,6-dideoxygalactose transaminase